MTLGLLIQSAFAQDSDPAAERQLEEITVTGSHIRGGDPLAANAVQILSREDLDRSGFNNLPQIFARLPVSGAGAFSTRGNSQDSIANGTAGVSLRGFGPDATLVLVNGRRVAISLFAQNIVNSFVDINTIPVAAADRHIPDADRKRFITIVETELMSMHEGNIARYRLRPSEFEHWNSGW